MSRSFRRMVSLRNILLLTISLVPLIILAGCSHPSDSSQPGDGKSAAAKDAQAGDRTSAAGKLDTGRAVLEAMAAAYRRAKTYQDNGTVRLIAQSGNRKLDEKLDFSVAFERPNKIHLDVYTVRVRCDGQSYHAFITDLPGQIVEKDAPGKMDIKSLYGDPILFQTATLGGPAGSPPQPLLLLEDNALKFILNGAEKPVLSEPGEFESHKCYRVQIPRPEGTVTFWIDQDSLVLRRIDLSTEAMHNYLSQKLGGEVEYSSLIATLSAQNSIGRSRPKLSNSKSPRTSRLKWKSILSRRIPANCWAEKHRHSNSPTTKAGASRPTRWSAKSP